MPTLPATPALIGSIFQGFNTIFDTQYAEVPTAYEQIAMVVDSKGQSNIYPFLEKIPGLRKLIGERKINDVQLKGYQIYNYPYEETDALRVLDVMTDNYGVYASRVRIMAKNAKTFPDLKIFTELLMGGFSSTKADGSSNTCYDGQPFFGTHTRSGNQFTNALTTTLDEAGYEQALIQLYAQLGSFGTQGEAPLMMMPDITLVCGPQTMQAGKRVTKAEYNNYGATNINFNSAKLLTTPAITDKSWYLLASDAALKPFIWQNLTTPEFTNLTSPTDLPVFMRQEYLYGVIWYCGWGFTIPELAVGSTGGN